jgi:NitT/TauT family transport system substrate-binding protein
MLLRIGNWVAALLLMVSAATPALAGTPLTMQAGSARPSAVYMPLYIAEKVGYFADEGLDVTVRYGNGGPLAAQLVASGDADIAHIVFAPVILGHSKGLTGKFFYQTYTHMMYFLAAPEGGKVQGIADLKGKNVGVFNMGSAAVQVTNSMAQQAGVSKDSINYVAVGAGTQALSALESGQVDALALWDAVYATYEAAGEHLHYIYHPTLKNVGNGGFFASDKALAEKAAALRGFARAVAKATVFLKANPEAAARIYWEVNPAAKIGESDAEALQRTEVEMQFVAEAFDVENRPSKKFGEPVPGDLQANIDLLDENGLLEAKVTPEDIVTEDFVAAANDFDAKAIAEAAKKWTYK